LDNGGRGALDDGGRVEGLALFDAWSRLCLHAHGTGLVGAGGFAYLVVVVEDGRRNSGLFELLDVQIAFYKPLRL